MSSIQSVSEFLFWISLILILHSYFGIFFWVWLIGLFSRHRFSIHQNESDLPSISIFIPAFNEEKVIRKKIENHLSQDYPADKMEIIVASDCSTDNTNTIVEEYASRGVRLWEAPKRLGKLGMLDTIVYQLSSEVVVVTDANVLLETDALRRIAEPYVDEMVGGVAARLDMVESDVSKNMQRELTYKRFENKLKSMLSRIGLVTAVFGGIYSFRRKLFVPIGSPPADDDVIIPLEIIAAGKRMLHVDSARAVEETSPRIRDEFNRRVRVTAYNLNGFSRSVRLSLKAGIVPAFVTFSYKLLRWLAPYLLLFMLVESFILIPVSPFYQYCSIIAGIILLTGALGWVFDKTGRSGSVAVSVYHLLAMNFAMIVGLYVWIRGVKSYWKPQGL